MLTVDQHIDLVPDGMDLERVPLPHGPREQLLDRRQRVDSSGQMRWLAGGIRRRVEPAVVDLNLVPLVHGELPVVVRIGLTERREPQENARVVVRTRRSPVYSQHEVLELLRSVPEQPDSAFRLQDLAEYVEPTTAGHQPTFEASGEERLEPWLDDWHGVPHDRRRRAPRNGECGP